ncbi:hypothetical protein BJX68DRAFT_217513 [Aspergillus pseudodeflectus]|uniref:Hydrophobin n=1 Tax=Aspergillus pseudodeflectus TaxID=176178 RepID=A0ABR4KUF3_9EURO
MIPLLIILPFFIRSPSLARDCFPNVRQERHIQPQTLQIPPRLLRNSNKHVPLQRAMHRFNEPHPQARVHGSDLGTRHLQGCRHVCPDASTNCRGGGSGNRTVGEERGYWQVMVCKPGAVCCRASSRASGCCGDEDKLGVFINPTRTGECSAVEMRLSGVRIRVQWMGHVLIAQSAK